MIEVVEREYKVGEGTKLKIGNVNGAIRIEGYEGETIQLKAEKKWGLLGAEPKIKVKKEGNMFTIKVEQQKTFGVGIGGSSVNFNIRVPKGVEIEKAGNVNGAISIKNVEKAGKISTVNGSISIENTSAEKISAVNGSITALLSRINDNIKISTVNGRIEAYIPKDADAVIKATAVNGKIDSEVPGELSKPPFHGPKSFNAVLGNGKYEVVLSTVNGTITIKSL
ncbi:DUF4097 family beta strand repeat protein [Thermococcus bergensis]|uniref:DUF4097 family beta strand repeat-containing protein n=1 Tax=Thermococcus bergensis TaxID=2689387 RepID=UPI001CEC1B54|nr:DUF4097 family beta strand repeat-containing protein [Thermococcus bergensis]MCA6213355.1 DUF4097 family beta strand repeat protein [Thermococcus bergensis]